MNSRESEIEGCSDLHLQRCTFYKMVGKLQFYMAQKQRIQQKIDELKIELGLLIHSERWCVKEGTLDVSSYLTDELLVKDEVRELLDKGL